MTIISLPIKSQKIVRNATTNAHWFDRPLAQICGPDVCNACVGDETNPPSRLPSDIPVDAAEIRK